MKFPIHIFPLLFLSGAPLFAQDGAAADPFAPGAAADPFLRKQAAVPIPQPADERTNMSFCFEVFSLDAADAAALRRKVTEEGKLYDEVIQRVESGRATQEHFSILRGQSGDKVRLESVAEMIYPTEYLHGGGAPPVRVFVRPQKDVPAQVFWKQAVAGESAPPLGTAYETRNTGFSLVVEPALSDDRRVASIVLEPEFTELADRSKSGQGISTTEMPEFETQRLRTAASVKIGVPFLLATPSRPPVSKLDADVTKKVWFAFVTVDLVRQ